jgi:pimeloyl-ACP methyl ester carboxylesterase
MPAADAPVTVDRLVDHVSTTHAAAGKPVQLFLREVALPGIAHAPGGTGGKPGNVVLMVHGGFWPSTLAFDLRHRDYSWMDYLARAGFDVFCMDMTGYGFSSRPAMDDPANVKGEDQQDLFGRTCEPSYPYVLATSDSEADDIDRVVDFIRALRGVDRISLLGWSGGGIRTGTYTDRHPEKVEKLVLFASSNYARGGRDAPPELPEPGYPILFQTREKGVGQRWMGTVHCEGQVEPGIAEIMWRQTVLTDPVGATWGPGGLRAPSRTLWGWNEKAAARLKLPVLVMAGEHDRLFDSNVHIFEDLGSERKAHLKIRCASHFAAWEMQRHVLHAASAEWLRDATLLGATGGKFEAARDGRIAPA